MASRAAIRPTATTRASVIGVDAQPALHVQAGHRNEQGWAMLKPDSAVPFEGTAWLEAMVETLERTSGAAEAHELNPDFPGFQARNDASVRHRTVNSWPLAPL